MATEAEFEAVLAAVAACPHRGPSLPVSRQPEGCRRCGERYACALGPPVTTEGCVRCVTGQGPRRQTA